MIRLSIEKQKLYLDYNFETKLRDGENLLKILQKAHLICGYTKIIQDNKEIYRMFFRYDFHGKSIIRDIKCPSSNSKRLILTLSDIQIFLKNYPYGTLLVRTSKGFLTGRAALNYRIGGEIIAYIL